MNGSAPAAPAPAPAPPMSPPPDYPEASGGGASRPASTASMGSTSAGYAEAEVEAVPEDVEIVNELYACDIDDSSTSLLC